jgi:hypothetical protein
VTPAALHTANTIARLVAARRLAGLELDKAEGTAADAAASDYSDYADKIANEAESLCIDLGLLPPFV